MRSNSECIKKLEGSLWQPSVFLSVGKRATAFNGIFMKNVVGVAIFLWLCYNLFAKQVEYLSKRDISLYMGTMPFLSYLVLFLNLVKMQIPWD